MLRNGFRFKKRRVVIFCRITLCFNDLHGPFSFLKKIKYTDFYYIIYCRASPQLCLSFAEQTALINTHKKIQWHRWTKFYINFITSIYVDWRQFILQMLASAAWDFIKMYLFSMTICSLAPGAGQCTVQRTGAWFIMPMNNF